LRTNTLKRLMVLIAFISSALTGCASAQSAAVAPSLGVTPTVTVPSGMPVVIAITGRFDDAILAVLDQQVAGFEADNPGIRVELVQAPRNTVERHDTFASDLRTGDTTIDILAIDYPWLAEFAAAGWLVPLEHYAESTAAYLGAFLPAAAEASTIGGQLMALPWAADGGVLYYRQDLLTKSGYAPPTTWPDLQHIALDVKRKEALPYGYVWQGAPYEGLTCNTLESVWAYGGDVLDDAGQVVFDSPPTRAALQQMADLIATDASPAQVVTFAENQTLLAFRDGNAVFMRNWFYAWDRVNQEDSAVAGQVGMAPLPTSCLGGQALALSSFSLHKTEAFRFMAFLTGYDQQLQAALLAEQPPVLSAVFEDARLLAADPGWQDLHAALAVTRPRPVAVPYAELSQAIYTEVNRMLVGQQDPAATAANVQRRIKAIQAQQ
jgi:multiple sugar transport system substrate-binding protein